MSDFIELYNIIPTSEKCCRHGVWKLRCHTFEIGNSLEAFPLNSYHVVYKILKNQSTWFSYYFCKEFWVSKKILEFVSEMHVNRVFTTWVKTSLSYIIVKMTSWAAKWISPCQNKPKFVQNSAATGNRTQIMAYFETENPFFLSHTYFGEYMINLFLPKP